MACRDRLDLSHSRIAETFRVSKRSGIKLILLKSLESKFCFHSLTYAFLKMNRQPGEFCCQQLSFLRWTDPAKNHTNCIHLLISLCWARTAAAQRCRMHSMAFAGIRELVSLSLFAASCLPSWRTDDSGVRLTWCVTDVHWSYSCYDYYSEVMCCVPCYAAVPRDLF